MPALDIYTYLSYKVYYTAGDAAVLLCTISSSEQESDSSLSELCSSAVAVSSPSTTASSTWMATPLRPFWQRSLLHPQTSVHGNEDFRQAHLREEQLPLKYLHFTRECNSLGAMLCWSQEICSAIRSDFPSMTCRTWLVRCCCQS